MVFGTWPQHCKSKIDLRWMRGREGRAGERLEDLCVRKHMPLPTVAFSERCQEAATHHHDVQASAAVYKGVATQFADSLPQTARSVDLWRMPFLDYGEPRLFS